MRVLSRYTFLIPAGGSSAGYITSHYGQFATREFFTESFTDIYTHSQQAGHADVEKVKKYKKHRKAPLPAKYKYNRSIFF